MLLRDLLTDPELGLVLLCGEEHVGRPVRGVYVTDLLDPRRYLTGGELVLSGLVWHTGPEDSERFAAALADADVAGLVAGTARLGGAPQDLVDACRRYEVPLLQVPLQVSFNEVTERVLPTRPRHLVSAVASGAEMHTVLVMASAAFGTDCWVLSPEGRAEGGGRSLPEEQRHQLVRQFLQARKLPTTVKVPAAEPGEDSAPEPFVLYPVGSESEPRVVRWFLAVRAAGGSWSAEEESVASELATAVALLRSRLDESCRIAGRTAGVVVRMLLEGQANPADVSARLEAAGLPAHEPMRLVALDVSGDQRIAVTLLGEIAASIEDASVITSLDSGALAVFSAEAEALAGLDQRLQDVLATIEPGLRLPYSHELRVSVGLSDVVRVSGLRGALEEVRYARRLAEHRSARTGLATGAELASHQVLVAAMPDELRRSYHDRLLGSVVSYDATHGSDLVNTLRVFLECSGSWSRCAKLLHVHVNTLRYRIQRIEEITGRNLSEFPDRVDFYLAFQLGA